MKKITVLVILIISLPKMIFGCICYMTESFDIQIYDEAINVVEVKVINKIEDDYNKRVAQYKKDTTGWNKPYPPIPMSPPNDFTEFNAEIVEVFKGGLKRKSIILRASGKNSSCYWEPEIQKSYIFYSGRTNHRKDRELIEIGGCQRRIHRESGNYHAESRALRAFKENRAGKFIIDQSDLIDAPSNFYIAIKGKFKKGQRHGKWTIAAPVSYSKERVEFIEKVLILKYKNGKLIFVKYSKPQNNHIKYFTRRWIYYYEEKIIANIKY